jgi:probable H4MPT-linked C1 transfer pathway protein
MNSVIGWDIGGAHLKGAKVAGRRIVAATQIACPLWLGLDRLETAFNQALAVLGPVERHVVTMTGELADLFPSRHEGVLGLAHVAQDKLAQQCLLYAGRAGFVPASEAKNFIDDIASANWHASACVLARYGTDGLLVDMGSTTTDLVPVIDGRVEAQGYSDTERLACGELVYTGFVRSFVMAMAQRAPVGGRWLTLVNENFATSADVYRILRQLPADVDQQATADGRSKTFDNSIARLARMVGGDVSGANPEQWVGLARWFAEMQLRSLTDAAMLILSRPNMVAVPLFQAGIGDWVVAELGRRLGCRVRAFTDILPVEPAAAAAASRCGPAAAIACLAASPSV